MKKFLSLFLVAIMCFNLVACGSSEEKIDGDSSNNLDNETNIVEITTDNWNKYFEMKDRVYVNPVGDIKPDTIFTIKEGFKLEEINLSLEYTSVIEWHYVEIDNEEKSIVVGDLVEDKTSEQKTLQRHVSGLDENGDIKVSLVDGWSTYSHPDDQLSMTVYTNFNFTSVEGTITLAK